MQKEELMEKIYKKHLKQLSHIKVPNKKLVICFSGIPGSGKTYISKILEKKYKGIRIKTDDIRSIITKIDKTLNLDKIPREYIEWFIKNNKFKNRLIILDKGIDREYKTIFNLLKKKEFKVFIIRLKASRKILKKRIFEKQNKSDPHFDSEVDRWTREWKGFGKKVKSDMIIKNEKNKELDLNSLFKKLDNLIR